MFNIAFPPKIRKKLSETDLADLACWKLELCERAFEAGARQANDQFFRELEALWENTISTVKTDEFVRKLKAAVKIRSGK